jgi:ornithine carbamoyltransferase
MHNLAPSSRRWSLDTLPADERRRVIDMAAVLERAAHTGQTVQTLRGKNLAVLCEGSDCPGLDHFRRAASALGARVTHLLPSEILASLAEAPQAYGRLLGRLYDAIDCHGLQADVLDQLAMATGKPVFCDLACQGSGLERSTPRDDFTLQALLLSALA